MSDRPKIPRSLRFEVLARDGFRCVYCGREAGAVELHVDHVKAYARGGLDVAENLVSACVDCNLGKSDRSLSPNGTGYALMTRRRKRLIRKVKAKKLPAPVFKVHPAPPPVADPHLHLLNLQHIDSLDEIDDGCQLALIFCVSHQKFEWHNIAQGLIGGDEVIQRRTKPGWTGRI